MARLFRSGLITASATLLSRILGLVRDVFIANILGAGLSADVFFFANRIPNFLRRLFAEGAFSQAFVPVMTEFKEQKDPKELNELVSCTVGTLGAIVFLVTIIGMLGSSIITALFGWGWYMDYLHDGADAIKFTQASFLLKLTFPYLFFITLTAVSGAILNTYGKFAIPAITPCLLNLAMIGACVWLAPFMDPNEALAYGVLIGGVIQLLLQLPFLYRLGQLVIPKFSWRHPGVTKIRKLMIPALFGVSVSQVNLLINTMLASFLATGAISYLYYSDRLLEFPIGIFAVAISTVILPALAKEHVAGDHQQYVKTLDWGVKLVLALGIPAMIGMIMLREPIIRVLFLRGAFSVEQASCSAMSLVASVSGLWAIMLTRVLIPGFNARLDTKTPVKFGIITVVANICFNLLLVMPLEHFYHLGFVGLALSTALASVVNVSLLLITLHQRQWYRLTKETLLFIGKLVLASVVMGIALVFLANGACTYFMHQSASFAVWAEMNFWQALGSLVVLVAGGAIVYGGVLTLLGIKLKLLMRA